MVQSKIDYFIERTDKEMAHIKMRVDDLWDRQNISRGKTIALSALVGVVLPFVTTFLTIYFGGHK